MLEVIVNGRTYAVAKISEDRVVVNGVEMAINSINIGNGAHHVLLDGRSYELEMIEEASDALMVTVNGRAYAPQLRTDTDQLLERLGMNAKLKKEIRELKAPMPGLVLDVRVAVGQEVSAGEPLIVLEAMKMENILKAPKAVRVKGVLVSKGQAIEKNTVLITFE